MENCKCNCGKPVNGNDFLPGHDQRLRVQLENEVGGLLALRDIVHAAKKYSGGEMGAEQFENLVRRIFSIVIGPPEGKKIPGGLGPSIELRLSKDNIRGKYLTIPRKYLNLFPPKTPSKKHEPKLFIIDSDGKSYKTHIEGGNRMPRIVEFFDKNKQLKEEDKVYIDIIAPMERYRLRTK